MEVKDCPMLHDNHDAYLSGFRLPVKKSRLSPPENWLLSTTGAAGWVGGGGNMTY